MAPAASDEADAWLGVSEREVPLLLRLCAAFIKKGSVIATRTQQYVC